MKATRITEEQRRTRRQLLGISAGGGAALAGLALGHGLSAGTLQAQGAPAIVGTWRLTTTDQGGSPENSLMIFSSDGTYLQNSSPDSSTGMGVWRQNADGSFALTFEQFGYMPSDSSGGQGPAVRVKILASIQVAAGGASLSGSYQYTASLPDGTVVDSGSGTATATRMQVESVSFLPRAATGPAATGKAFDLTATDNAFSVTQLMISSGDTLTVTLHNQGLAIHDWHVPDLMDDAGIPVKTNLLRGGESQTVSFVLSAPGTYAFRCDVHPTEQRGMLVIGPAA